MLCKCYWIVLYIVHFTAFCLGGPFFSGHGVKCAVLLQASHAVVIADLQLHTAYLRNSARPKIL